MDTEAEALKSVLKKPETPSPRKGRDKDETKKYYQALIEENKPKEKFTCETCGMTENCHYKGRMPPFVSGNIQLRENCYVMRDPFSPPPPHTKPKAEYFLIVGSNCCKCGKTVCKDLTCSFFYASTYCLDCAIQYMSTLPKEIQNKVKTQLSSIEA